MTTSNSRYALHVDSFYCHIYQVQWHCNPTSSTLSTWSRITTISGSALLWSHLLILLNPCHLLGRGSKSVIMDPFYSWLSGIGYYTKHSFTDPNSRLYSLSSHCYSWSLTCRQFMNYLIVLLDTIQNRLLLLTLVLDRWWMIETR